MRPFRARNPTNRGTNPQPAGDITEGVVAGMLVRNYRSHSSLLQIPNRLFYGDALQAAADQHELLPPRWDPRVPPSAEGGPSNHSKPLADGPAAHSDGEAGTYSKTTPCNVQELPTSCAMRHELPSHAW